MDCVSRRPGPEGLIFTDCAETTFHQHSNRKRFRQRFTMQIKLHQPNTDTIGIVIDDDVSIVNVSQLIYWEGQTCVKCSFLREVICITLTVFR